MTAAAIMQKPACFTRFIRTRLRCLASLKDENGNTLLFAVTACMTHPFYSYVQDEIFDTAFSHIVNALVRYGVDKDACVSGTYPWELKPRSSLEKAVDFVLNPVNRGLRPDVVLLEGGCCPPPSSTSFESRENGVDIKRILPILGQYPDYEEGDYFHDID
ncbi:hypothetical protein NA57DRAFT_52979 [Rhizodiscina lignyota]|uniref:Uncharacterized protein n=1 Tax=Rhizodiscina lignyota TaxID=1504668 RepID=A0A9P4IKZ2_9PEZI|nr:hypothetical protein NA57DRAFT_52979 [Rhizodiscina lignyota]